ncbi:cytochrome-c peroxidase [Dyadobacter pollutisoli]|uniref:Cytochrome C peroxidase n=1 Tax=Dyadobacter pollutisoli TaxID=2910158 RepID=A0A9E8ND61_9BACT|nr:cytochrome c peroxidase [Dyadobacter pollutisoli]WAC14539.1 cytochrome C peroxidase [Dyadobacter pollutisoli]
MAAHLKTFVLIATLLVIAMAATDRANPGIGVHQSIEQFRADCKAYAGSLKKLTIAVKNIDSTRSETVTIAKSELRNSRLAYKKIEYFLEYFFFTSSRIYNRAPKNEIEEPFLEYQEPAGMQYMEAMLYEDSPAKKKPELLLQCNLLNVAADDLTSLLYQFQASDKQLLESVRIQLIRIIALGISGFDAPLLKSGIDESYVSLQSIAKTLEPYLTKTKEDSVQYYLKNTLYFLKQNPDFDSFDRLSFLTDHALPLQKHLGLMISRMGLDTNSAGILNYHAEHLFIYNAFEDRAFGQNVPASQLEVELGKKLFSEAKLSGNGSKSCASCHQPEQYFTDGLPKSIGLNNHSEVRRNAPSLLYSGYQHNQFWDGRAKTLEEQIATVMQDSVEMNGNPAEIAASLSKDRTYIKLFRKAGLIKKKQELTEQHLYRSLAAFIRTLKPFNSDFDKYLAGDKSALTTSQKNGFNLFMGKAQCGTCHFAPVFNGLVPPLYKLTEFEILGTTLTDDLEKPVNDPDNGRFDIRPTPYYKGAFKTPTVRNAAKTAPYMHHGTFGSLEKVIEFYNKGGGGGLGLDVPRQTLSTMALNLNEQEKTDLISFLHSLTDHL